jgi:hypothetical protein
MTQRVSFFGDLMSCFISRPVNVLTGDSADWAFSGRVHRDGWARTEAVIDALFWIWEGPGHCRRWYDAEIERSRENVERHEAR